MKMKFLMRLYELLPEEKLLCAIFYDQMEEFYNAHKVQHFLSPEGIKTANEVLNDTCLSKGLSAMTDLERRVLRLRYGFEPRTDTLHPSNSRTLAEIGTMFGCTKEWIRSREQKALRKLRHPSRSRKLNDYLPVGTR